MHDGYRRAINLHAVSEILLQYKFGEAIEDAEIHMVASVARFRRTFLPQQKSDPLGIHLLPSPFQIV
jgi:hypothetical protein